MQTKQHSRRGQRMVTNRYDSEDEDLAPRSVVPSISFTTTENGTNSSISSSLSGSCKRRPVEKPKASLPRPRRIRDDIIIADDSPALYAPNNATAMVLSTNNHKSRPAALTASRKVQAAALRHQSSTMTRTTTTTTVVTKTTLCLEPTSSSSFSSGCLQSPSNVGAKSTRGQEQIVTRPDRRHVNARDDVGDDSEDEPEEYKSLSPKRNPSSSVRPSYRVRTTASRTAGAALDDDNASSSSSKNSSSVDSSINKHPKKWRVVDVNKHNHNVHYSSTASMPRTLVSSLADDNNNSSRSKQTTATSRTMSSIQLLNQERVRAAEMRTARMRAMMHENMIRPNSFRGFSSRTDNKVAAGVNKSTAAPVKPCRVKSSEGGQKPVCPVKNTMEKPTTIAPKSRQVARTSSSKTPSTLSPRGVNRHPSSNAKVMADDLLGKRHTHLRRHVSVSDEEASDIDSLVQEEEEYITEVEECVSSDDEYTEEEVLVSDEEEEEEEERREQKQDSSQQLRRVGRWGERQQKSWKCGATTRTRESIDPSVDVTEDVTENTTQYDSDDEQQVHVVKEEKYEPYFPQFDELMRTRQSSRRVKDQIKLSPGAMSLKDRLALFQANK